jgi:shikimate kinase
MSGLKKTVALVGMMGAGKTSVGKRLAARLGVPFRDADTEIEDAAGMSVAEIFARFGEAHFRDGERRVIARLLADPPHVLATGGGAYMDDGTRTLMGQSCFTIWLKAPVDLLLGRVRKRQGAGQTRPLLANGDMRATLTTLLAAREPVYAQADMTLESADGPHAILQLRDIDALEAQVV